MVIARARESLTPAPMCAPCKCTGTLQYVHVACLSRWCRETGVTSCELCLATFPQHFVNEGKDTRRKREQAEEEAREAAQRLQRQAMNFQRLHGRPPTTAMDYAVINLNSMLEADAVLQARMARHLGSRPQDGSGGDGDPSANPRGIQVVVIDSMGRARTLRAQDLGGHLSLHGIGDAGVGGVEGRRDGVAEGPRNGSADDEHLRNDLQHMYKSTQFRFWMKVIVTTLFSFLILYAIVAMVGGDDSSHSSPIFIFRLLGLTLPLVLIGRAVWLFRRRRQMLVNQMNRVLALHGHEAGIPVHHHHHRRIGGIERLQIRRDIRRDLRRLQQLPGV